MNARNRELMRATFGSSMVRTPATATPEAPQVTPPALRHSLASFGKPALSFEQASQHVDFAIVKEPLYRGSTSPVRKEFRGMFNSKTGYCVGVVGDNFTFYQPRESLEIMRAAIETVPGAKWRSVQVLDGGASISAFASIETKIKAKKVGDSVGVNMFMRDFFDGGGRNVWGIGAERLACTNGMTRSENIFALSGKHTPNLKDKIERVRLELAMRVQDEIEKLQGFVYKLDNAPMSQREHNEFTLRLFDIASEEILNDTDQTGGKTRNKVNEIRRLFTEGTGNVGRTRWDSFNAVTEYTDWHGTFRQTEQTTAEENRFVSLLGGTVLKLKDRAAELLLA